MRNLGSDRMGRSAKVTIGDWRNDGLGVVSEKHGVGGGDYSHDGNLSGATRVCRVGLSSYRVTAAAHWYHSESDETVI